MAAPAPTSAASSSSSYEFEWGPSPTTSSAGSPSRTVPDLSPPLIAMVAVVGTAFLIVLYVRVLSRYLRRLCRRWHRWRCRRRLFRSTAAAADYDPEFSPPPGGLGVVSFGSSSEYFFSPYYGLDESTIKALPLSLFSRSKAKQLAATNRECAVCLLEFEDDDSIRTLPLCSHAFHVDCIDVWLRSHATCPLCRSAVLRHHDAASPFVPMRAARIRPSFDDLLLDPMPDPGGVAADPESEIAPAAPSPVRTDDRYGPRDFLLKRSYSFGFERSLAADRLVMEASTVSPWRYRHRGLWSKRWPSPFGGVGGMGSSSASRASRVFSFRSSRGGGGGGGGAGKSPFFRRRGFFPLSSESIGRFVGGGAGPSWRRSRSMTSPSAFFMRPLSATVAAPAPAVNVGFSSSRMRCGDPEALLSPERLNRR